MILAHIGDVRSLFDLVGFQEGNRDADIDPPCKRAARKAFYLIFRGKKNGAPEEIRTPDPQIRSLVLYPAELRVRAVPVVSGGVAIL